MNFTQLCWSVLSLLILHNAPTAALPTKRAANNNPILYNIHIFLNSITEVTTTTTEEVAAPTAYALPQNDKTPLLRAAAIDVKKNTFLYGPPLAGGPYFPGGPLGTARVTTDQAEIQADLLPELAGATTDSTKAAADVAKYDGLDTLQDYTKLYEGEWQTTLPHGPDPGVETNYTQDLLFSMERLSISPYQVKRLNPRSDSLAFTISAATAKAVSGMTLRQLFHTGRLFYADYRDQEQLNHTVRYGAACDAYFYIDRSSSDFLPLAIRTNVGANLIYTPQDSPNDWQVAKMIYHVNDFWFSQWNHLAGTHEVVHIAYMAAIRTLSEEHPVLAILNRLMYEVFAIQPLAATILFPPGAIVDQVFAFTGGSAQSYTTNLYQNKGSGRFQANYFYTDLESRGLLNCNFGPALKDFPFHEDASVIWNAQRAFMESFVRSYYSSRRVFEADKELQAWVQEANGQAKVIDFPSSITCVDTLVDVLTHFAYLASTAHHTANTNELLEVSSTLPLHPSSLYQPIPTSKNSGVQPADFLPPLDKSIEQLSFAALFARPFLVHTNRTLVHAFDDEAMLSKLNTRTRTAAATFMRKMKQISSKIGARGFDGNGLSQGMPFVWKALDPDVQPYSITT